MHYDKCDWRKQYFSKHDCFYRETLQLKHYLDVQFETDNVYLLSLACLHAHVFMHVCVCICMCVRERQMKKSCGFSLPPAPLIIEQFYL